MTSHIMAKIAAQENKGARADTATRNVLVLPPFANLLHFQWFRKFGKEAAALFYRNGAKYSWRTIKTEAL